MLRSSNFRIGLLVTLFLCALAWKGSFIVGLSAVLLSSFGLFWLLRGSDGSRLWPFSSFAWLALHALVVAVFGFQTIGHFVGWQEGGSPAIPLEQQRRVQYNGYYIGSEVGQFALISPQDQTAKGQTAALFVPPQLASGERIAVGLVPQKNEAEAVRWRIETSAVRLPLRLDGWIINPNAQWLTPGAHASGFSIYSPDKSKRIKLNWLGVQWRGSWPHPKRERDIFRYSQNNCRDGSADCGFEVALPPMEEGQKLERLLGSIVDGASADETKQFARVYVNDPDIAAQIAPVIIVRAAMPGAATVAPAPTKGRAASDLGLLGLPTTGSQSGVVVASATSAHQPLLRYGLDEGENTLEVRLPAQMRGYDQGAKAQLRAWPLEFVTPQRWAIPTEADYLQTSRNQSAGQPSKSGVLREFILTSSREYIPLPGYLLAGNGQQHEFFARGQLRGGLDSWAVTDGKMARQNDGAARLSERIALGDAAQGALVSLEPTRAYYAFTGRRAALLLGAALLLYGAVWLVLWRAPGADESGDALPADGAWHLLWVGAFLLALVRLITAYRVSLLPPSDASADQLISVFSDSLRQSLWLIFWAPAVVATARLVTWMLEPQRRLKLGLPIGLGALITALLLFNAARLDAPWPAWAALGLVVFTLGFLRLRAANTPLGARIFKATSRAKAGEPAASGQARLSNWLSIAARVFVVVCALGVLVWSFQNLRDGLGALRLLVALGALAGLAFWFAARGWLFWLVSAWLVPTLALVGINTFLKALPGSPNLMAIVALTGSLAVSARLIFLLDRGLLAPAWGGAPKSNVSSAARGAFGPQRQASNRAILFTVVLALVSLAILVGALDFGLLIIVFPLLFALAFLWWVQQGASGLVRIAAPSAALAISVALLWALPHTSLVEITPISNENNAIFYRLAVYSQRESDILLDNETVRSRPAAVLDKVKRNSQQQWQMLHYAQQGRHNSPGYGGAPLSRQSMSYDTAISDCVFSVLLVSEHGASGALAILAIYLLIGGACLWGIAALPHSRLYRVLPLALVGAYFVCQALYMAAANLGLTVFTGQNLPLLSLRSGSDALQGLMLLGAAAWLVSKSAVADMSGEPPAYRENSQLARAASLFGVLALAGWGAIAWGLSRLPMPQSYNVDDAVIARLRDNPPQPWAEGAPASSQPVSWRWADAAHERAQLQIGQGASLLEREYARAFNESSAQQQRDRSKVYFLSTANVPGRVDEVRINPDAFRVSSPFARLSPWTGAVLARGPQAPQPTLSALGRTFSLSLSRQQQAISVPIDFDLSDGGGAPQSQRGLSSVVLVAKNGGPTLAEIKRGDGGAISAFPGQAGGHKLWVGGQELNAATTRAGKRRVLKPFDILTIERERDGRRVNLIYLGDQAPPLAFSQWRNGRTETFYRQSDVLPWSAAILDVARGQSKVRDINLSLDLPLHEQLQRRLSQWAKSQPDYRNADQAAPAARQQRLALTVMDAYSGEVLALPCWPLRDPSSEEFEQIKDPVERERLLFNHNLANHAVGSTFKPITFAALASQAWGELDIAQLRVPIGSGSYSKLAEIPFGGQPKKFKGDPMMTMSGAPGALGDNFMVRSRNWPHFLLGALGLAQQPADWKQILRVAPSAQADLFYGDRPYQLDLRALSNSPLTVATVTQSPRFVPSRTKSSLLFRGYRSLADVAISDSSDEIAAFRQREIARYWPNLAPAPTGAKTPLSPAQQQNRRYRFDALGTISPDVVRLNPDKISTLGGEFSSILLGGGDNRWNNVAMSETIARLVTGQKVEATFISRGGGKTPQWPAMPAPWNGATPAARAWKNANFVRVLQAVGENPRGTAYKYLHGKTGRYVGLFKTGTVNEDKVRLNSETLLFVVGEFRDGAFVPGRTVAGYLYMQKSTSRNDDDNAVRRATLFPGLLKEVTEFLDQRERAN